MDTENLNPHRDAMLKRLARVEGQIRGIQAMIRRDADCEAIAQQFSAARGALDKAYQELLSCLIEAAVLDPAGDPEQVLQRVRHLFAKYA